MSIIELIELLLMLSIICYTEIIMCLQITHYKLKERQELISRIVKQLKETKE